MAIWRQQLYYMSSYAVLMTKKSMIFQIFRRYEFSCKTKPIAIILHVASTQNMHKKYGSVTSKLWANGVRSPPGRCSSIAITRQLAIMVTKTVYSNGGHSMINLVRRRNGWSSANRNNDVGPFVIVAADAADGAISLFTFGRTFAIVVTTVCSVVTFAGLCLQITE